MKWRRWYWLGFLAFAVVVAILFTALPGGNQHCRFRPNAEGCSASTNAGVGVIVVLTAVVLLGWWVWWKWQQHRRRSR
jgi:uncharacterized membrane protein